jgi:TRAP-type mannitol/chloroaromatic compound transport system substrate-binding protein
MLPGIHQPASQTELIINKEAYAALPDDLKAALKAAVNQSRLDEWLWMEQKNIEAVKFLKDKGIVWVTMDPETITTMQKWAAEYLTKRASKDKNFAKVWNSIQTFSEQWYPYHKLYNLPH